MRNLRRTWLTAFAGLATGYWVYRRINALNLRGRIALVTGGSRGLGLAIARELACQGADLALTARDAAELARAAKQLAPFGVRVETFVCDAASHEAIDRCVETVTARMGCADILVNVAGQIQVGPLADMTEDDFDTAFNLHVKAPLRFMSAVLPSMRRNGEGRIINIASFGGVVAVPHMAPYSASKFALVGLSDAFRTELALEGICVTTVCPGLMRTGSQRKAQFEGHAEKEYAWFTLTNDWPVMSIDADAAARKIVWAMRLGQPRLDITLPAILGRIASGLIPNLLARSLITAARLLPTGVGSESGRELHEGAEFAKDNESVTEAQAAKKNNEKLSC